MMKIRRLATICTLIFFSLLSFSRLESKKTIEYKFHDIEPAFLLKHLKSKHNILFDYKYDIDDLSSTYVRSVVEEERQHWLKILENFGYWSPEIRTEITKKKKQYLVQVQILPHQLYKIADVRLLDAKTLKSISLPLCLNLPLHATSQNILSLEQNILRYYLNNGYATANFIEKEVLLDDENETITLVFKLDQGREYRVSSIQILGPKKTVPSFVKRQFLYQPNTLYNLSLIEKTEEQLANTGLFSQIRTETLEPENNRTVPIILHLQEGKSRSIGIGAKLATDAGAGGKFEWQNRNLTGHGDLLAFRSLLSKRQKNAYFLYTKPDFFKDGTQLRGQLEYNKEFTQSFHEEKWEIGTYFEHKPFSKIFYSYGAVAQLIRTSQTLDNSQKLLWSFPLRLNWSSAKPSLLPKKGRSHSILIEPFTAVSDEVFSFVKIETKNSFYFSFYPRLVLATQLQAGTITGSSRRDIPPPLRYFQGSSHTLRGYSYKTVSPLSSDGSPIGGRSFVLAAFEPRFQLTENMHLVPFYEIGQVYLSSEPDPCSRYITSCGLGYHVETLVGPIRLDLAFPLTKRKRSDPSYQLYLSIGAAF